MVEKDTQSMNGFFCALGAVEIIVCLGFVLSALDNRRIRKEQRYDGWDVWRDRDGI
jgi:hypothetical protein